MLTEKELEDISTGLKKAFNSALGELDYLEQRKAQSASYNIEQNIGLVTSLATSAQALLAVEVKLDTVKKENAPVHGLK